MQKYLDENFNPEKLAAELHNEYSEFYFAFADDKLIGYLKINRGPAQTTAQDDSFLEIERIYVLKEYHGKQAGQVLFETALNRARELQSKYIWLGVWEKNPRAIAFYRKNGFLEFDKHVFILGDDRQTDIMMKLPL
jgi:ribosomal protein S18 acetylase RimI-like enzyme